jgi:RecA/RadA recombinase
MSNLMDRLLKVDKIGIGQSSITDSKLFKDQEYVATEVPMLNVALAGDLDQGMGSGFTTIAAPSKHFKSLLALIMIKAYLNKHSDAVCIFYDSEFGITLDYMNSIGVDISRVVHAPIGDIEELKLDFVAKLNEIKRGDHVVFLVDSIGNLPSKKEADDADEGNTVLDMTRAKALNSFWRLTTTAMAIKDIPGIIINRSYDTQEFISKKVLAGGQGAMFSPNVVLFVTKSQEKKGKDFVGWTFTLVVEKSRYVLEKTKLPLVVTYENGINKWGGFLDDLILAGSIAKSSKDKYQIIDKETGELLPTEYSKSQIEVESVMRPLIYNEDFKKFIRSKYQLSANNLLSKDDGEEVEQPRRKSKSKL